MRSNQIKKAAELLSEAWLKPGKVETFPSEFRAKTRDQAYAIQDAMADMIGFPVVGWKLGATSPAMRLKAGHDGPIIGRIFDNVMFTSPVQLPIARFPHARVECEFAFRLLDSLPARSNTYTAKELSPLVTLHLAIEIIGNRYPLLPDFYKTSTIDEIADNGTGIGFVFGNEIPDWKDLDLINLFIDCCVDDHPSAQNFLGADRANPIDSLVQALDILCYRGISVSAGQYISTGAATDPQPIKAGSKVRAKFGSLGDISIDFH